MNRILRGDVLSFCRHYKGPLFHGVLCDPPYGLSFMGKDWDHGVPGVPYWEAIRSICRPGAWLLAFGGTKTHHRLMVAIEDAGWELRDCMGYLYGPLLYTYGAGFPKSHNIGKAVDKLQGNEREKVGSYKGAVQNPNSVAGGLNASPGADKDGRTTVIKTKGNSQWEGYGTALKPSYEPVILAMNPRDGTFANNALEHGCGGLWIDGCRVGAETVRINTWDNGAKPFGDGAGNPYTGRDSQGRWPANLILDDSEQVRGLFPQSSITGKRTASSKRAQVNGTAWGTDNHQSQEHTDSGSAARFFKCCPIDRGAARLRYSAKASKAERNAGCEGMAKKAQGCYGKFAGDGRGRQTEHQPTSNHHPTVKPLSLTEYLARLILPPEQDEPRRIFCPFAGSGSEAIGAMQAGWDEVIGVELEREYIEIAEARLAHWMEEEEELPLLAGS